MDGPDLIGQRLGCGRDLAGAGLGELAHDLDELGVLQARDQERPAVGPLLRLPDLALLGVGEGPPGAPCERLDVELELLGEQAVHCAAELEEFVDGSLTFLGRQVGCHLVDEECVEAGVAGLVDPMEAQDVAEQSVEFLAVADVLDVVQLGEPLDHAGEQQRRQRGLVQHDPGDGLAPGDQPAMDCRSRSRTAHRRGASAPGA